MKYPIPEGALAQHIIALGKTGSGKSSKLRVLVEGLLEQERPTTIVDPKGDWWGLKSSADGKRSGYPIVIFGGEHADVPINEFSGPHVAELVATGNRSALIDLGGWMVGERTRFFMDFASNYFKLMRGLRTLVLPEVHNFAPQGKIMDPASGKMLHWANRLASEGRGKGLTILADSQRPQKVHKDFLTSCETLIACRVIHKLDRDAIKDWIDGCADPAAGKQVLSELAQMQRADAWVWSPEIEFGPKKITWPMFRTYDSFKPQPADAGKLTGWAEVDLDEVRSQLESVVKEAQENDPAELKKRIRELERKLEEGGASQKDIEAARRKGFDEGYAAASAAIGGKVTGVIRAGDEFMAQLRSVSTAIEDSAKQHKTAVQRELPREFRAKDSGPVKTPISTGAKFPTPSHRGNGAGESLPVGEAKTLTALIQYPNGLRREQLTVLTGYKRSARDTYIQRLKARGYLTVQGDTVIATDAGCAALPNAEPLPTGRDLQAYWLERLPQGERRILEFLIECWPADIERNNLDETGYKRSARNTYLQRLRAKQLVVDTGRGLVKASDDLFGK